MVCSMPFFYVAEFRSILHRGGRGRSVRCVIRSMFVMGENASEQQSQSKADPAVTATDYTQLLTTLENVDKNDVKRDAGWWEKLLNKRWESLLSGGKHGWKLGCIGRVKPHSWLLLEAFQGDEYKDDIRPNRRRWESKNEMRAVVKWMDAKLTDFLGTLDIDEIRQRYPKVIVPSSAAELYKLVDWGSETSGGEMTAVSCRYPRPNGWPDPDLNLYGDPEIESHDILHHVKAEDQHKAEDFLEMSAWVEYLRWWLSCKGSAIPFQGCLKKNDVEPVMAWVQSEDGIMLRSQIS